MPNSMPSCAPFVRPINSSLNPAIRSCWKGALQRVRQVGLDRQTDALRMKLGAHRRLPSPSATIDSLRTALRETPADLAKVSAIVAGDLAMSIQLLRLVNSAFFGPPTKTLDPHRAVSILGADILMSLLSQVELFRPVGGSVGQGEATVTALNDEAAEAAASMGPDVDLKTRTMMQFAGRLAALETPEPLGGHGEQALGRLLLAYWGFDVDMDDHSDTSGAHPARQADLQDA